MKKIAFHLSTVLAVFLIVALASTGVSAQEDVKEAMKKDKTGTNPVNFSKDLRFYNEFSWLNTAGDGQQNLTTIEFRTPFADGKWQWRIRVRYNAIEADFNDDGIDDVDEWGFGDIDMRFLTVPYIDMAKKHALAMGLELFLDTASEDVLGSGAWSLGPQVFYVKFLKRGLFAPGLQYKFSVDEDEGRSDVDQILIDLNYLLMAKDKLSWFFTDPQIVIDNESDQEYAIVDLEFGFMMQKWFPNLKGQSTYIRPMFALGNDRPVDGAVEVGYKILW